MSIGSSSRSAPATASGARPAFSRWILTSQCEAPPPMASSPATMRICLRTNRQKLRQGKVRRLLISAAGPLYLPSIRRRRDAVANATHGLDQLRAAAKLLSKPEDMGVDRPIHDRDPSALDELDQAVTGQYPARVLRERKQELELV